MKQSKLALLNVISFEKNILLLYEYMSVQGVPVYMYCLLFLDLGGLKCIGQHHQINNCRDGLSLSCTDLI